MAKSSSLLKSLDSSPSPKILSKKSSTTLRSGSLREGILSLSGQASNVTPVILTHKEQGALPSRRKSSNLINQNGLQLKSRGSDLALDNGRQRSNGKQSESFFGDDQTSSWAGEFEMERQRRQKMRQESLKNRSASKDASAKSYESTSRSAGSSRHWMSGTVNGSLIHRSSPQLPQRPSPVPPPPPPTSGSMNRSSVVEYPFDRPPPGLENSVNRAERRKMIMDYESQLGGYVKRSLTTTSMESPPPEDTSSSQELSEGGRELVGSLFKLVDGGITEDVNAVVSPAFKRVCPITGMHLRRLASSSSSETSSGAIWLVERPSVDEFVSGKYWSPLWASRQPKWVEMHELDSILRHQLSQMSVNAELQMYNSRWNWKAFKKTPKLLPDQQDEVPAVSEPHPPKFGRAAYSSVKQPRSLISWIPETPALIGSPSSSSSIVTGIDMPLATAEDLERHQCAQVAVLVESLSLKLLTCLDHTQEDSFRFLHHLSPLIEDFIGACMLIGGGVSVPGQGALEYSWDQDLPACLVSGFCQMVLLMHKGVNLVNRLFRLLISRDLGLSGSSKSESSSSSQALAGGDGSDSHLRPSQSVWDCCMVMLVVLIRCIPVLVRCCKASDSWDDPVIPFGVLIKLITDPISITHHDHQTSSSCSSSSCVRILSQFWLSVSKPGGGPEKDLCSLYVHSQVLLTRLLINTPSNCMGRLNMALVFMYKCLSAGVVQAEMAGFARPHGLINSRGEGEQTDSSLSLQSHLSKGHCVAPLNVTLMGSPAFLLLNCLILGRLKQDAANVYISQLQKVRTPLSCSKCFQLEFTHLLRFITKFVVYEALATLLKHPAFAAHVSSERAAPEGATISELTSSSISPFVAVVIEAARLAAEDRVIGKFVGVTLKNELTVVDPAGMLMLIQSKYEDIKNVVV